MHVIYIYIYVDTTYMYGMYGKHLCLKQQGTVFEEASDLEVSVAVLVAAHAQVGPRAAMTSGNSCGEG